MYSSMTFTNVLENQIKFLILKQAVGPAANPEVEEGGGRTCHRVGLIRPCGARSARNFFFANI